MLFATIITFHHFSHDWSRFSSVSGTHHGIIHIWILSLYSDFVFRSQNKSPPAKKVLHTTTVGLRGRSDSVTSNESLDLGIRSEKPTMHERSTPTKTKAPALIINRNDNVRTSQEAGVVSLPELAISSTELGEGRTPLHCYKTIIVVETNSSKIPNEILGKAVVAMIG